MLIMMSFILIIMRLATIIRVKKGLAMKKMLAMMAIALVSFLTYVVTPVAVSTVVLPATEAHAAECSLYEQSHPNFLLSGAHLSTGKCATCATCHAGGVFLGTPKTCAACHNGSPPAQVLSSAVSKSSSHFAIGTATCDSCHNTTSYTASWNMTHASVTSLVCSSCHNGSYTSYGAMTKASYHVPTTAECSTCHAQGIDNPTHTDADWTLSHTAIHAGITTGCVTCHDGAHHPALGKADASSVNSNLTGGHPSTSDQCETCHSINNTFKCALWDPFFDKDGSNFRKTLASFLLKMDSRAKLTYAAPQHAVSRSNTTRLSV
jgi:hypothetical protein